MSETHSSGRHARHVGGGGDTPSAADASQGAGASGSGRAPDLSGLPTFAPDGRWAGSGVSMAASGGHHHHGDGRHRHHRRRRIVQAVVGTLLVLAVILGAGAFLFYRSAMGVRDQASTLVSQTDTLQAQVLSGDTAGVQSTASSMACEARSMREETSGFLWNVASALPVYGSDVAKVRALASVADDLSENALVPLASQLSGMSLSSLVGTDGTIDVASLSSLASALTEVAPVVERSATTVDGLGSASLEQVDTPLQKARTQLDQLSSVITVAADVAPVLPSLLGADGQTRTYLIVAQENSEIRSTGGFPGAWGELSVTDGKLSLGSFEALTSTVTWFATDAGYPITSDEAAVFGDRVSFIPGDVGFDPDFTRVSAIWKWMWEKKTGTSVDGVVAVDPVFLQSLLGLVGGVTTSDGTTLDGSNAAQVLMNQVYWDLPVAQQDAFFQEAAALSFSRVVSNIGTVSLPSLTSAIRSAAKEGHLLVWLADESEQATISGLGVSGALSQDPTTPTLGVYLSNVTYGKIDWYLDSSTSVGPATANADGTASYAVTTTLSNTMTDEEASELPSYIRGYNSLKRSAGDMVTQYYLFAPAGGTVSNVQFSGGSVASVTSATYEGLQLQHGVVQIEPGETVTVTYTVTTSSKATSALSVRTTPTATSS